MFIQIPREKEVRPIAVTLSLILAVCLSVPDPDCTVCKHFRCDKITQIVFSYSFQILNNNTSKQEGVVCEIRSFSLSVCICNNFCKPLSKRHNSTLTFTYLRHITEARIADTRTTMPMNNSRETFW